MKIQTPSLKTIEKVLGCYKLGTDRAALLRAYMRASGSHASDPTPEFAHKRIDEMLGNFGIESFRVKVRGQIRTLYYSNSGDTYTPTVMRWDWIDGGQRRVIWLVGCWGDIAEHYPEVCQ